MKSGFPAIIILCACTAGAAVDLRGTVTDRLGTPIEGALVLLLGASGTDLTDNAGKYLFNETNPVVNQLRIPETAGFRIHNGDVTVSLAGNNRVRVNLFDMNGALIHSTAEREYASGTHRIPLSSGVLPMKRFIIRASIGEQVFHFGYIPSLNAEFDFRSNSRVTTNTTALAKSAGAVDSLRVSKAGFKSQTVPVTNYVGVIDIVLDTLENTGTGTSGHEDGFFDRMNYYGESQYYWGDMNGDGTESPIVMINHAVSADVIDVEVVFNPGFVDLTYGTGSVGWNPRRPHTFRDLEISDHVEIAIRNADGDTVFWGRLDLISASSETSSGYASLGPLGGDGSILMGNESDIVSFGSSLDDNVNYYGYELFQNSPPTDENYTMNPEYPNWQYYAVYRITISTDAFGSSGYGDVGMTSVHASPSKTDIETVEVHEGPPPEETDNPFDYYVPPSPVEPPDTTTPPDDTIPDVD